MKWAHTIYTWLKHLWCDNSSVVIIVYSVHYGLELRSERAFAIDTSINNTQNGYVWNLMLDFTAFWNAFFDCLLTRWFLNVAQTGALQHFASQSAVLAPRLAHEHRTALPPPAALECSARSQLLDLRRHPVSHHHVEWVIGLGLSVSLSVSQCHTVSLNVSQCLIVSLSVT